MLQVGVTIKHIGNKHLQNLLIFRVWIIWGAQKSLGGELSPNAPYGYGPGPKQLHRLQWLKAGVAFMFSSSDT